MSMSDIMLHNPTFATVSKGKSKGKGKVPVDISHKNCTICKMVTKESRRDTLEEALWHRGIHLVTDTSTGNIRRILESAGSQIGSVHFVKRSNGRLRKMSYRLHVKNPTVAKKPSGGKDKQFDIDHDQMTVFDVNKIIRNRNGTILGRGAWRTVPLENVVRICIKGQEYILAPSY